MISLFGKTPALVVFTLNVRCFSEIVNTREDVLRKINHSYNLRMSFASENMLKICWLDQRLMKCCYTEKYCISVIIIEMQRWMERSTICTNSVIYSKMWDLFCRGIIRLIYSLLFPLSILMLINQTKVILAGFDFWMSTEFLFFSLQSSWEIIIIF